MSHWYELHSLAIYFILGFKQESSVFYGNPLLNYADLFWAEIHRKL